MNFLPKIYKIDRDHRLLKNKENVKDVCETIVHEFYKKEKRKLPDEGFEFPQYIKNKIAYYLYLHSDSDKLSDWAMFLPDELKSDLKVFYQTKISLILFMESEHALYALVGGTAYQVIVNFIDHQFGLSMYDRIISLENDEAISTKSRGITGQRVGMSEQFRDQHKMINYLQFGKIPKDLQIKLYEKTAYEHFHYLMEDESERLTISVGKAFRINRSVTFNDLHNIIEEIDSILELAPKELLSSYIQEKDEEIIKELQLELNRRIFNNIPVVLGTSTRQDDQFDFDFCSPNNNEAFYDADYYRLKEKGEDKPKLFSTVIYKEEIYGKVIKRAYELCGNDQEAMLYYLRGVRVHCYKGRRCTTRSQFLLHLNTEINYKGESVFLIDTGWYRLKDAFIKSLNTQTELIFKNFKLQAGVLDKVWKLKPDTNKLIDEGVYNGLYENTPNFIVMDTVTPEGVEICDILHITETKLYLIHVKHSFTARVRELTNQIQISARRVTEAIASNNKIFFAKAFDSLKNAKRGVNNFTKDEFINLFFEKKIIYVFATASQFKENTSLETNLNRYKSNIAKFSLTTCSSEVRTSYSDLLVFQIERE